MTEDSMLHMKTKSVISGSLISKKDFECQKTSSALSVAERQTDPDPGPDPGPRFLLDSIVDPVPVFKEVFKGFCTLRFLSSSSLSEESGVRCRDWDLPPPNNGDFVPKDVPELIEPALRKGSVATLKIERKD